MGSLRSGLCGAGTLYFFRLKARQLRANPYGVDGYVIVVSFGTQEAVCSFHRFEEEE